MKRNLSTVTCSLLLLLSMTAYSAAPQDASGSFRQDLAFLKQHTDVVVLKDGGRAVAVVPQYQGRVMTSTSTEAGDSYGWLNYALIEKGLLSAEDQKGELEDHIYVFGGEERFWLGPEGGQFSIFFKPGAKFEFSDWKTPASLDTLPYEIAKQTEDSILFTHDCELENYSGTKFSVGIERTVRLLDGTAVADMIQQELPERLEFVAYETDNVIVNRGEAAWTKETGLLSIWILGMYKPTPGTTVVIPYVTGAEEELGPVVNDAYFGKVAPEYISVTDSTIYFKGDGTRRGKIGLTPQRSKGVAGSYDEDGKMLTLVTCTVPEEHVGYVNSMWELQDEPFAGDMLNSYNDGSPGPGLPPLGPFYELETSSPAAALAPGERIQHIQRTLHITGPEADLDAIAKGTLGVGLDDIINAF